MKRLLLLLTLAACAPAKAEPTVKFLTFADTTVRYQVNCGEAQGQQIETCSWLFTKGGVQQTVPNGFSFIVSFTGQPNDSIFIAGTATTIRRGKTGPPAAFSEWLRIADVAPPGANPSVKLCTKDPPACN